MTFPCDFSDFSRHHNSVTSEKEAVAMIAKIGVFSLGIFCHVVVTIVYWGWLD